MSPLVVGHGNGHNRPELVAWASRTRRQAGDRWASFSGNETQRLTAELLKLGHVTVAPGRPANRVRSTCVVTSREYDQLGETSLRIADAMPAVNEKLYPDRALAATFYQHPIAGQLDARGVAHFSAHPPPTVMKHDERHPVVRSYRHALAVVRDQMKAAQRAGYLLVLTGDLQANAGYREPWGPRAMLAEPLRLRCHVERIDWLMHDERLQLDDLRLHELYDHTGFIARMVKAG